MKFKSEFLREYVCLAPLALAFERAMECTLYEGRVFEAPVLDIGCGEGLFGHVLFAEKIDTGIDLNERELSRARELGGYAELIPCNGANIPKPDGTYRTIFSNSVLEHIPDLTPVIKEAHRLLAPGGRLYVTVPSEKFDRYSVIAQTLEAMKMRAISERYRRFYNRFWDHYHFHSLEGWKSFFESCDFDVLEAFCYGPRQACLLNDFLVPFSLPRMAIKRLTNRWVLFPKLRRLTIYPFYLMARRTMWGKIRDDHGGLVFMALTRR